jgi:hypothetical protein
MSLFAWYRKQSTIPAEPASSEMTLDESIAAIAALRNEIAMQDSARRFSLSHGPAVIPELQSRFDVMIEPPPSFSAREPSACAWITCWQTALYTILYQYREHALPVFRQMASNDQNCTAIVLLCRLAAEGVDRQQIVADLVRQMPDLPFLMRCEIVEELLWIAHKEPALTTVIEELRQSPAFEEALVEVRSYGDDYHAPLEGPCHVQGNAPRGVIGRRVLLLAIAIVLGIGSAFAVVGSTGIWGAGLAGVLTATVSAAVLFLVEVTVLNRM